MSSRYRILAYATAGLLAAWVLTFAGYKIAGSMKVTAEKVRAYVELKDLSELSPAERAKAIQRLADMLNALTLEERRQARLGPEWDRWFAMMSEEEKSRFIEATMPTGFKQMIGAFEQLPEEQRKRAISDALRNLREAQTQMQAQGDGAITGTAPILSEDLQKQVATIGLQTFYGQSSAQTKAELAPVLEELQRMMEGGRFVIRRQRGR
jgi:hypothetical protein